LEKARELDIPKEIVERNIKKASEKGQETYTEKVYEVTSLEARMIFL
jgi:transcriptional/translational regulatory protein YebC/TACO1